MPLRVALLIAGLALGLLARAAAADSTGLSFVADTVVGPAFLLLAGWSLMVAAVVSLSRPSRRTAVLLYGAGALWFVRELANPSVGSSIAFTAGLLLYAGGSAVVGHLALSYPTGRLPGRWYLVVVVAGYVIMVGVLGLGAALTFDPLRMGCFGCPTNLVVVDPTPGDYAWLNGLGLRLGLGWLVVAIAAAGRRMVSISPSGRRGIAPVIACAVGYLLATAGQLFAGLSTGMLGAAARGALFWLAAGIFLILLALAVSLDLWRNRRARRSLTTTVIPLGRPVSGGGLREALSTRFRDPSLSIAYSIDGGRYVDASARDVDIAVVRDQVTTPLMVGNSELAVIRHRPGVLDSRQQVDDLIASVHLGLENERLHARALAQLEDLRASGVRIVAAGDNERRRIERDLHDGAQQRLVGLLLSLRLLAEGQAEGGPELQAAEAQLQVVIEELRQLAQGIYPMVLKDLGLPAALDNLTESCELTIESVPNSRYPGVIESTVYQLVATMATHGPARVEVCDDHHQLTATVVVTGFAGSLEDLSARVSTLAGSLVVRTPGAEAEATLRLPLVDRAEQCS